MATGRIRSLKPDVLEREDFAELSDGAWRLYFCLKLIADDYGNFRAHERMVRGTIFWGSDPDRDLKPLYAELVEKEHVLLWSSNGQSFGHFLKWEDEERVDKPGRPRVPAPPPELLDSSNTVANSRESRESPARVPRDPSAVSREPRESALAVETSENEACRTNSRESRESLATDKEQEQEWEGELEREQDPRARACTRTRESSADPLTAELLRVLPVEEATKAANGLRAYALARGKPKDVTLEAVVREASPEFAVARATKGAGAEYLLGICKRLLRPGELAKAQAANTVVSTQTGNDEYEQKLARQRERIARYEAGHG